MENILKKALSEALTPLYSEELRGAYDTGYKFSPEFEKRMRELIRGTSRPLWLRPGVIAAAACAVIGIGSAILIPALMNSRIDVQPPADTSVTADTAEPVITVPTPGTTAPVSSETSKDTTPGSSDTTPDVDDDASIVTDTSTDPVTSTSETTTDTTPEPSSALIVDDDGTVVSPEDEKEETEDGDDAAVVEDAVDDDNESIEDDDDDDISVDNDVDEDIADDDDDAVVIEPDSGDYQVDEEVKIPVNDGDKLGDVVKQIDEGFSFGNEWANSGRYSPLGIVNVNISQNLNFYQNEYGFIQDFVHTLGDAEASSEGFSLDGVACLELWISPDKVPVYDVTRGYFNISAWENYSRFYNTDEWDATVLDDSDDGETMLVDDSQNFKLTVYSNGFIKFDIFRLKKDDETGKTIFYTLGNNIFKADIERINSLFAKLDSFCIPDTVKTVGDIADALNINSANIAQAWVGVDHIYDTTMTNAKIGSDYIENLFAAHSADKVTDSSDEYNGEIRISFYTKDSAWVEVYLSTAGKCFVRTWNKAYCFNIKKSDIKDAMNALSAANNVTIPLFDTLGEYTGAQYLNTLRMADYVEAGKDGKKIITDEDALKKILDFIKAEFSTAKYLVNKAKYGLLKSSGIMIFADGFAHPLVVGEDDILYFRWYRYTPFKMSDGFTARLIALLDTLPAAQPEQDVEDYDDDDADEIVFNDDDEDNVDD